MKQTEDLQKLQSLIKGIHIAMLSTIKDGEIHTRPMATNEIDAEGCLWFFTRNESEKVAEIEDNSAVSLGYASPESNTYVVLAGTVEISHDIAKIHELWNPFIKAWFPGGPEDPQIGLLKFHPSTAEYWDSSSSKMVVLFNMAKAALTGKTYDKGEHGTLNLN